MVNFKEIYHFSRFQRGSNIFQGGSNFFQGGGGGSNCLFPIETHITCDFPGGSRPPVPPLDPHLVKDGFRKGFVWKPSSHSYHINFMINHQILYFDRTYSQIE